jgi:uncharacterized protein (DUF983 family)
MNRPLPKLKTVLWRGWRQRCPQCGVGKIYKGWVALHDHCPKCHLQFLRDQGDLWAYLVAVDRALFIFPMVIMIYFRLYIPDSKWFYVLVVALLAGFVYTLPHRNGMCLGADYLIRRKWGDLMDEDAPPKPGESPGS